MLLTKGNVWVKKVSRHHSLDLFTLFSRMLKYLYPLSPFLQESPLLLISTLK